MNLDDAQKRKVGEWIAQGLKLFEIQKRLLSEFGLQLTYMDVRLLVDDLKLTPKDVEPVKPVAPAPPPAAAAPAQPTEVIPEATADAPAGAGVSVKVDQLARPGALVSGKVTFSDGKHADWYLDQTGRLGLVPQQAGYRPPATDLKQFQATLELPAARNRPKAIPSHSRSRVSENRVLNNQVQKAKCRAIGENCSIPRRSRGERVFANLRGCGCAAL
jgi:hypothetical protein